jgi:hypothetical protein
MLLPSPSHNFAHASEFAFYEVFALWFYKISLIQAARV